ncbi:MAG TPA: GNAT family N-acetyltransferase [Actinomycetota bacterium]|nr:GNAT family N-acetyltransferase [Actinomycetota bacterium]
MPVAGRIETDRLLLAPLTQEAAHAALSDPARAARLMGASVAEGWPSDDLRDALPVYASALVRDPGELGWGIWAVIDKADVKLAGDVGFKGKPDGTGTVEIGYGIAPPYRRRGYAVEASQALIDWGFSHPEVHRIVAECLEDNTASIGVLEKLGMVQTEPWGRMLRWELKRS